MLQSVPNLEKCPLCPRGTPPSFGDRSKLPARGIIRIRQICWPSKYPQKTPRVMVFDPGNLDSQRCNLRSKGHSGRSRLLINSHQVSYNICLFYLPFSTKSFTIGSQFFHVASWRWCSRTVSVGSFRYDIVRNLEVQTQRAERKKGFSQ